MVQAPRADKDSTGGLPRMTDKSEHWVVSTLITIIAVGMSLYHLNIAWTGGYEFVFQRSLSFLFGVVLVVLVYRPKDGSVFSNASTVILFVLAILAIGYPVVETDYLNGRLFYVDPLKPQDFVLGSIAILLTLEVARRTINTALPLIVVFFLIYTFFGAYFPWEFAHKGASFKDMIDHHYLAQEGLWNLPLGRVLHLHLFIHPVRRLSRPHGRRGLLCEAFHGGGGAVAGRPGQGGRIRERHDRFHHGQRQRERGDHRPLHHSDDEEVRFHA